MAGLRGGNILHVSGGFVLDRIQSAGPGDLSIPEEKIYELGNYEAVGTVRDIPEITFNLETYDMSSEFEALLINENPATFPSTPGANKIDFKKAVPIDIISPWKSRRGYFDIVKGVSMPYLTLESATYRFGVGENSTQSFSLRGDSIFYTPGQVWAEKHTNTGVGPYTLDEGPATVYKYGGDDIYVLSVLLTDSTTGAYKRVLFDASGVDGYSNTSTTFTLPEDYSGDFDVIHVTYGTAAGTADYPQTGNGPDGTPVHVNTSVKPAAVRGKDIDVYIGTPGATPTWSRLTMAQNFEVTWSVTLENMQELGSERFVSQEYDVPDVTGSIGMQAFDAGDFFDKLSRITGVPDNEVIGPNITVPVPLEVRVSNPDTGARMKTFYIPDARFTVPGYNGQANSVFDNTLNFTSEGSVLEVFNGARV